MKVLAIGNSFSQDASAFVHDISLSGSNPIEISNLYISGCKLITHAENCRENKSDYLLEQNGKSTQRYISIKDALLLDKWDFVTMQQASGESFKYSSYMPYIRELSDYIKQYAPQAEQVIHCTWQYEPGCDLLEQYGAGTSEEMYMNLKKAYALASHELGGARIIPSGDAMHKLITDGKQAHRDTFHALDPQGRYLLGLVWYRFFTGDDVTTNNFVPKGMTDEECAYYRTVCMDIIK